MHTATCQQQLLQHTTNMHWLPSFQQQWITQDMTACYQLPAVGTLLWQLTKCSTACTTHITPPKAQDKQQGITPATYQALRPPPTKTHT